MNGTLPGPSAALEYVGAVPEPETYALLLAGLGLMGTVARRRKGSPQLIRLPSLAETIPGCGRDFPSAFGVNRIGVGCQETLASRALINPF